MNTFLCKQCGHVWVPRTINPQQCPKCKSLKWADKKAS